MNDETNTTDLSTDPVVHYSTESEISNPLDLLRGMLRDFSVGRELAGRLFVRNLRGLYLNKLAEEGSSIILVTHAVGMLQRVADRAVVFGQGKIIHDGDLKTVKLDHQWQIDG